MLDTQYLVNYYSFCRACKPQNLHLFGSLQKTLLQVVTDFHIPAELLVSENQALQPDGKPHITAPNHILYLEVQELCREPKLLYHTCILPGCKT